MSGDHHDDIEPTPVMSGYTPPEHSLDCPGCGSEVFIRETPAWYTDEEEHCAGCGSRVMVALDEDAADPDLLTARVYVYEHGGEVVARLRAEVMMNRVESSVRAKAQAEVERLKTAVSDMSHTLDVESGRLGRAIREDSETIERLTRERDAEKQLRVNTEAVLGFANGKLVETTARAETAERDRDEAQRRAVAEIYIMDTDGPDDERRSHREIAAAEGWPNLYPTPGVEVAAAMFRDEAEAVLECACGPGAWRTDDAGNCAACGIPIH